MKCRKHFTDPFGRVIQHIDTRRKASLARTGQQQQAHRAIPHRQIERMIQLLQHGDVQNIMGCPLEGDGQEAIRKVVFEKVEFRHVGVQP